MKRILNKYDVLKLGHKLHQLQKRLKRAIENGYPAAKIDERSRRIKKIQNEIKQATA
jgi:hypothetical protein